jgi:hypothetical protein
MIQAQPLMQTVKTGVRFFGRLLRADSSVHDYLFSE